MALGSFNEKHLIVFQTISKQEKHLAIPGLCCPSLSLLFFPAPSDQAQVVLTWSPWF